MVDMICMFVSYCLLEIVLIGLLVWMISYCVVYLMVGIMKLMIICWLFFGVVGKIDDVGVVVFLLF